MALATEMSTAITLALKTNCGFHTKEAFVVKTHAERANITFSFKDLRSFHLRSLKEKEQTLLFPSKILDGKKLNLQDKIFRDG
jgi:hypothetical protein